MSSSFEKARIWFAADTSYSQANWITERLGLDILNLAHIYVQTLSLTKVVVATQQGTFFVYCIFDIAMPGPLMVVCPTLRTMWCTDGTRLDAFLSCSISVSSWSWLSFSQGGNRDGGAAGDRGGGGLRGYWVGSALQGFSSWQVRTVLPSPRGRMRKHSQTNSNFFA